MPPMTRASASSVIVVTLSMAEAGATAMPPPIDHRGIGSGAEPCDDTTEYRLVGWPLPPGDDTSPAAAARVRRAEAVPYVRCQPR